MKETVMRRTEAFGLGTSVIIHATVILMFVAIAGRTSGIHKKMVTVVLDGQQIAMGSGNGEGGSPRIRREAAKDMRRSSPAKGARSTAWLPSPPSDRPVREERAEKRMETAKNSFSEAVSNALPAYGAANTGSGLYDGGRGEGRGTGGAGGTAGGSGAGGGTGTGSGRGPGGIGEGGKAAYLKEHFAFIRELIMKNLIYPAPARRMGWKGHLTVSFVICEGGSVENIRIVRSSGHKILDENALSTVKKIQPFPKPPVRAEIVIPIEYRLG